MYILHILCIKRFMFILSPSLPVVRIRVRHTIYVFLLGCFYYYTFISLYRKGVVTLHVYTYLRCKHLSLSYGM